MFRISFQDFICYVDVEEGRNGRLCHDYHVSDLRKVDRDVDKGGVVHPAGLHNFHGGSFEP